MTKLVFYNILSFIAMLICNVIIIVSVVRAQRVRSQLSSASSSNHGLSCMTLMLMGVSIWFLITTTPLSVLYLLHPEINISVYLTEDIQVMKKIFYMMMYMNHCFNFLCYCISGTVFRKEVYKMFQCKRLDKSQSNGAIKTASLDSNGSL